jgi:hypothetical protein
MTYLFRLLLFISLTSSARAETGKVIRLCDNNVAKIFISSRGTALDFPTEPQDVVLGAKGSFSIKYIRNDLTISPTAVNSRSNLFVYLQGRRFVLDLTTSTSGATLYFIKDCMEEKIKVKINGK